MKIAETKDRIKLALKLREMKQTELVEKTGIDKGQMSSYISGRYKPKQKNLNLIAETLDVDEAWLMGYDVPMERNSYEDQNLLMRDTELDEIEKILESDGYSLCCENYDSDFFTIKNTFGQTIAGLYDYELLPRYKALKRKGKVTSDLIISSEASFLKYLESLGYYIDSNTLEHTPCIQYDNKYGSGFINISSDILADIKSRIDTYAKATVDSIILKEYEDVFRKKRKTNEELTKQLLNAAHERTDIEVTDEMRKHDEDIMDDANF